MGEGWIELTVPRLAYWDVVSSTSNDHRDRQDQLSGVFASENARRRRFKEGLGRRRPGAVEEVLELLTMQTSPN